MSKKKYDFSPNEFVVYPAHGVGKAQINRTAPVLHQRHIADDTLLQR